MTNKEIESKIVKYLHKANRLKSTRAKLDCLNELSAVLRETFFSAAMGTEVRAAALQHYLELCILSKIKFQLDGLFSEVTNEMQRLKQHPDLMAPKLFEDLRQRLQAILEIDATYPEAQQLLGLLRTEYKEYVQDGDDAELAFTFAQYQAPRLCIEIGCRLQDFEGQAHLRAIYEQYQIAAPQPSAPPDQLSSDRAEWRRMRFYREHLHDFEVLHEELHTKASYHITVNQRVIAEQFFSDWFQCYRRFRKAQNPQYCYGASPFTFNFWGCHKLYTPDVARQLDQCWFHYGELDQEVGLFFVKARPIVEQIRMHLAHCGFCPALTEEKLAVGMALLPKYINPESDPRWRYEVTPQGRSGVLPAGNDIAIAALHPPLASLEREKKGGGGERAEFIEVGSTAAIQKILSYLKSNNPADLAEPAYKGLATCLNCGAPYKRQTLTCVKCRLDFGKYALRDLENTLPRLRSTKAIKLQMGRAEAYEPSLDTHARPVDAAEATVSFEQLWRDPEIQELLSPEPRPLEKDREKQVVPEVVEQFHLLPESQVDPREDRQPLVEAAIVTPGIRRPRQITARPDFQEKIRSIVSKRYRERKALEKAFAQQTMPLATIPRQPEPEILPIQDVQNLPRPPEEARPLKRLPPVKSAQAATALAETTAEPVERAALMQAVKSLKPRQKSELSKRGVVRVIYHATMDKETCPLCHYLDGMVMDPDDPATDIFSPPLYPGCTCSREYILKTEKPQHWPRVTFVFPPDELLIYLDK